MNYTEERDRFIAKATMVGLSVDTARALLRYATTLQRLAEAQCNGDYPADDGERTVILCPECGTGFVRSSFKKGVCPDCYAQQRVSELLKGSSYDAFFQGDPRGSVLSLVPAGSPFEDVDTGRIRGIAVPTR